ncbi:MAG: hypothetical protein Q7W45_13630 [Bacteroidota bacterium]|nr:hypothetical protein [Bacteroidota bacterium]MDP3144438.1 hypothetical protein [Bacteroidota bacterium]MDP3555884.1 hypothetical protein [Bacteroidota bacterium]
MIKQSSFKHDYFVTEMQYLEEINDTNKITFIAEVKISGNHENQIVGKWHNLLKNKAKELGANLYVLENYQEDAESATAILKLFFAGENFIKINNRKVNKNAVYVFNQSRSINDTACFFLNQNKINFDTKKYYKIFAKPYELYKLSLANNKAKSVGESFPNNNQSVFYVIYNKSSDKFNPDNFQLNPVKVKFSKNIPLKFNYNLGRFLIEIYR